MVKEDWKNREIEILEDEELDTPENVVAAFWSNNGSSNVRGNSGRAAAPKPQLRDDRYTSN